MEYIRGYLKIIGYVLCGLVFSFSAFYLLINIYHMIELKKEVQINIDEQPLVIDYDNGIKQIESKIANFDSTKYEGEIGTMKMLFVENSLKQCVKALKKTNLEQLRGKKSIGIADVYKLRDSYENVILSDCIINSLYWTISLDENGIKSPYLKNNQEMFRLYVSTLKNNTSYLKKDLLNNSSYYFNTSTASSGVKDNVRDGFYETLNAYKTASHYVELLANWFNNEVGGIR